MRCSAAARAMMRATRPPARVEDVIEALLEQFGGRLGSTFDDGHGCAVERLGQQARNRLRGCGCQLARLDHHGVARGERADHRREREHQRVVPRRDHQHDAERLGDHAGSSRLDREGHAHTARPHPARQVLDRVVDLGDEKPDLSELRLGAALAEICLQRSLELLAAIDQQGSQALQLFTPPGLRSGEAIGKRLPQLAY